MHGDSIDPHTGAEIVDIAERGCLVTDTHEGRAYSMAHLKHVGSRHC